jgi:hypothetical protein
MQPQVLQLRRLVIGEAGRFPELGRTYYERGPERTVAALASWFQQLAERGRLRLDDPLIAANHFNASSSARCHLARPAGTLQGKEPRWSMTG